MLKSAYIYDAIRTPRGKGKKGSLYSIKPVDLVVGLIEEMSNRFPSLDKSLIGDLILGVATPVGEQGADIARAAVLNSSLPVSVPGFQVNRFCASGLEATNLAAQKIMSASEDWVLAGGVESMSRVPMGSDGGALFQDVYTNYNNYFVPQGISADLIATQENFTRQQLDEFAVNSQQRAAKAWEEKRFAHSVVPVKDLNGQIVLAEDEYRRPQTTLEVLQNLAPAFSTIGEWGGFDAVALQKYVDLENINHLHTSGNSSGIVDGAALILLGSAEAGEKYQLAPRARIVSMASAAADPTIMLTATIPATQLALRKAGLQTKDIAVWEVNEAFAAVVLKWLRDLAVDPAQVNVNGGAIALGHPLGATGAILVGTALDELERTHERYALITLCVAGGMGVATIIERC